MVDKHRKKGGSYFYELPWDISIRNLQRYDSRYIWTLRGTFDTSHSPPAEQMSPDGRHCFPVVSFFLHRLAREKVSHQNRWKTLYCIASGQAFLIVLRQPMRYLLKTGSVDLCIDRYRVLQLFSWYMSDADDQVSLSYWDLCRFLSCSIFYWNGYFICSFGMGVLDKTRQIYGWKSYSTLIYYVGSALFPFVLFLCLFWSELDQFSDNRTIILIFTKILMFYKWVFFSSISGLFLLILYFCVLK